MNPMEMMQIVNRLNAFNKQHPKFGMFLKSVADSVVKEGDILELKYIPQDGKEKAANIKLTSEDIETINMLKNLKSH